MPQTMRASQSQDVIDVSANSKTPSSHARPGATDSPAKVQVKDSLENSSKPRMPSRAQQPPATPHAERQNEEEELYSISPEQKARSHVLRSQTRAGGPTNHSQKSSISRDREQESSLTVAVPYSVGPWQEAVAHVETQKSTTTATCQTPQRLQSVPRIVENLMENPEPAIEQVGTTSATRKTSRTPNKGSNSSKKYITTSQTSAMASTGKGKLKHIEQPLSSATARLRAKRAGIGDAPKDGATFANAKGTRNSKTHIVGSQLALAAKHSSRSQRAKPTDDRADGVAASRNPAAARNSPLTKLRSRAAETKAKLKDRMECEETKKFRRQESNEIIDKGKARATSPAGEKKKDAKQRQSQTSKAIKSELPPDSQSLTKMTKEEDSGDEDWSEKSKPTRRRQPMRVAATANTRAQEQAKRAEEEYEIGEIESPRTPVNEKAQIGKSATGAVKPSQKGQGKPAACAKIDDEVPSPEGNDPDKNGDPVQPETSVSQRSDRHRRVVTEDDEDGIDPKVSRKGIDSRAESGKYEDLAPPDEVYALEPLRRSAKLTRTEQEAEPTIQSRKAAEKVDEKLGDTQEYPVVLSDNERSSSHESSPEPDLAPRKIIAPGQAKLKPPGKTPRTPASMQCSNLAAPFANDRSMIHSRPDFKTTIISFDKSGPRNQGAGPSTEPGLQSGNNNRSSLPTMKRPRTDASSNDLGKKGPSSAATSARAHMSAKPAPASNVAPSFQDALVAFPGFRGRLSMSTDTFEPAPPSPEGRRRDEIQRREEPHLPEDRFDAKEDTCFYFPWRIAQPELELRKVTPTASQQAMPPPGKSKTPPQSLLPIETRLVPIQALQKVAKEFAQAKRSRTPEQETYRAAKRVKAIDAEQNAVEAAQSSSNGPVRISKSQPTVVKPADRIPSKKRTIGTQDAMDLASKRTQLEQIDLPWKDGSIRAPVKPFPSKHKAAASMTASISKPKTRRDQARQRRQPSHSQGLQTVDINGSPVPPDLNLLQSSTVLETFQTQSDEFIEAGDQVEQVTSGQGTREVGSKPDTQSRQSTTIAREGEEADLDQTLVDDEEAAHPTQRIFKAPKKMTLEPGFAMGMLDPLSDDLLSWCRTLKPHQLNLFDELVKVQLRVCQYIFEQENSIERILKEQHEQGLTHIKEQEFERAREYAKLDDVLRRTKREAKKDVLHEQEVVREKIKNLQSNARKWKTRLDEREQANRRLDTLLKKSVALR